MLRDTQGGALPQPKAWGLKSGGKAPLPITVAIVASKPLDSGAKLRALQYAIKRPPMLIYMSGWVMDKK